MAFHSKGALPLRSSLSSHSLLNTLQLLPPSICVCCAFSLCFSLQPNDSPASQPSSPPKKLRGLWFRASFPCVFLCSMFLMWEFRWEVSVKLFRLCYACFFFFFLFFCFLFKKASHLLRVSESAFIEYICCRRWRYSAGSQGSQSVWGNLKIIIRD